MKSLGRSIRRLVIAPHGIVERTVAPYHMPGNVRSSMYFAAPVTFASPSLRRTLVPTALGTLVLAASHRRNDLDDVTVVDLSRVDRVQQNLVVHSDVIQRVVQLFVDSWL